MDRPSWIAPLYGYAVCLIAVVTFLISVSQFVEAAFQRSDPLQGRDAYGPYGASLSSFEAYRATYAENAPPRPAPVASTEPSARTTGDTLTTAELRLRYDALRADRIARVSFEATKQLVKHGLLIVLAVALFATHWRWLRGRATGAPRDATRPAAA